MGNNWDNCKEDTESLGGTGQLKVCCLQKSNREGRRGLSLKKKRQEQGEGGALRFDTFFREIFKELRGSHNEGLRKSRTGLKDIGGTHAMRKKIGRLGDWRSEKDEPSNALGKGCTAKKGKGGLARTQEKIVGGQKEISMTPPGGSEESIEGDSI